MSSRCSSRTEGPGPSSLDPRQAPSSPHLGHRLLLHFRPLWGSSLGGSHGVHSCRAETMRPPPPPESDPSCPAAFWPFTPQELLAVASRQRHTALTSRVLAAHRWPPRGAEGRPALSTHQLGKPHPHTPRGDPGGALIYLPVHSMSQIKPCCSALNFQTVIQFPVPSKPRTPPENTVGRGPTPHPERPCPAGPRDLTSCPRAAGGRGLAHVPAPRGHSVQTLAS